MADSSIRDLTNALTASTIADADIFAVVDLTADETKRIVYSELRNALTRPTITAKTANYTIAAADENSIIKCTGTFTVTLPAGLATGFQAVVYCVSGVVTLAAAGGGPTLTTIGSNVIVTVAGAVTILHEGGDDWRAFGALE